MTLPAPGAEEIPSRGRWPSQEDAGDPPRGRHAGVGPKGYARADARIYEDVCEMMTDHGDLDPSDIEVAVSDGEVTLRGTVSHRHAKYLAENLAAAVRGVVEVRNELRLSARPGQRESAGGPSTETSNALYASTPSESRR